MYPGLAMNGEGGSQHSVFQLDEIGYVCFASPYLTVRVTGTDYPSDNEKLPLDCPTLSDMLEYMIDPNNFPLIPATMA